MFGERAVILLAELNTRADDTYNNGDDIVCTVKHLAKLPKLELSHYSGQVTQWPSFWDRFKAIFHTSDIPIVSKFTYLQSLLDEEVKSAIAGLFYTADHYVITCDILT